MFRISFNLEIGRDKPEPPEELLPGGTSGSAQVEDAGYGSRTAALMGTGFCLPEAFDPGPEGPY